MTPTQTQEELDAIDQPNFYRQYLRFKQKKMDKSEWLVRTTAFGEGEIHNGAHFPLCVFTNNARARSAQKSKERRDKQGNNWWKKTHGWKGKKKMERKKINGVKGKCN